MTSNKARKEEISMIKVSTSTRQKQSTKKNNAIEKWRLPQGTKRPKKEE